ncbi:MAG TPA: hypothetical protein VNS32_02100, partial [Flavisolibacter sp.]|nr:hypothetical protein [Flavisolibacter sp.]
MQIQSVSINFTGGIISPGYLKEILEAAQIAKVQDVRFGLRQQLVLEVPKPFFEEFERDCKGRGIMTYDQKKALPNILSSYPAAGIFTTESWVREGVFKDIFDSLQFLPKLKVNICDRQQSFVPFFTGHINWVSSSSQHFWHLYLRFPKTSRLYQWKDLVYTNDIPVVTKAIEEEILSQIDLYHEKGTADWNQLFRKIKAAIPYIAKESEGEGFSAFSLPYYEGFNKINNQLWLGIYRRNEHFALNFLMEVCTLCLKTRVGQLYSTPWKSIIVKNIEADHRKHWDLLLGKYRINVRHAANELNWQVEDLHEDSLMLKRHIIRYFDKEDVRTYGLCFAVQTRPGTNLFGSVLIMKQANKNPHNLRALDRYSILYKKDFDPNAEGLLLFRKDVEKEHLGIYLVSLCKQFYERQEEEIRLLEESVIVEEYAVDQLMSYHQCPAC